MTRKPVEFKDFPAALAAPYGPYRAVVRQVIDGDTLDCLVDLGFNQYSYVTVRLLGVNTPEVYGKEKAQGLRAKEAVTKLLPPGTPVKLMTVPDVETFGRYVATVFWTGGEVGAWLLDQGYAEAIT